MRTNKTPVLKDRGFVPPREVEAKTRKSQLYRHFDEHGELLYVGISHNFIGRASEHKLESMWFEKIATITVEHYPNRDLARAAEVQAIQSENPLHNISDTPAGRNRYPTERRLDHQQSTRISLLIDYERNLEVEKIAVECVRRSLDMHGAGWGWQTCQVISAAYCQGHYGDGLIRIVDSCGMELDKLTKEKILEHLSAPLDSTPQPQPKEKAA